MTSTNRWCWAIGVRVLLMSNRLMLSTLQRTLCLNFISSAMDNSCIKKMILYYQVNKQLHNYWALYKEKNMYNCLFIYVSHVSHVTELTYPNRKPASECKASGSTVWIFSVVYLHWCQLWSCFNCRDSSRRYRGEVASEYAVLIKAMWSGQYKALSPRDFRVSVFLLLLLFFWFHRVMKIR